MGGRKAVLRETVVEAAESIIAAKGLDALRAREVARRAGCSLGAIYTVFADLDDLALAVNERTLTRLERELAALPEPRVSAAPAVIEWLTAISGVYLDFAAANRQLWRALFELRLGEGKMLPEEQRARHNALFGFIERPLAQLGVGPDAEARRLLARSLFSAVHGMIVLGLEEKLARMPVGTLKQQIGTVVGAVTRGLLAGED